MSDGGHEVYIGVDLGRGEHSTVVWGQPVLDAHEAALSRAFRERLSRAALAEHERRIAEELAPFFRWIVAHQRAATRIRWDSPWWHTPLAWALTAWIVWRVLRQR